MYPAERGTIVTNVIHYIPDDSTTGPEWFSAIGRDWPRLAEKRGRIPQVVASAATNSGRIGARPRCPIAGGSRVCSGGVCLRWSSRPRTGEMPDRKPGMHHHHRQPENPKRATRPDSVPTQNRTTVGSNQEWCPSGAGGQSIRARILGAFAIAKHHCVRGVVERGLLSVHHILT